LAKVKFQQVGKARPAQISSAWLGKFADWGYVAREDRVAPKPGEPKPELPRGRPATVYHMTGSGNTCLFRQSKLTVLLEFIRKLQAARGTPRESRLYQNLFILADRLESNVDLAKLNLKDLLED
jgi:predicted ArsR family transcriptional regulator